jgi:hypothetical protein
VVAVSEGTAHSEQSPFQAVIEVDLLDTYPSCSEEVPGDESTSEGQECLVDVCPFFITNAQTAKLAKPGKSSFYYPPRSA